MTYHRDRISFDKHPKLRMLMLFIAEYKAQHPFSPDMREMMVKVGLSSTSVCNYYLDRLEQLGLIAFMYSSRRAPEIKPMRCARTVHLTKMGQREVTQLLRTSPKKPVEQTQRQPVDVTI